MNDNKDQNTKKRGRVENLIPLSSRTPEEQHAIRSKGGRNAVLANQRRKTAQEVMQNLLACEIDPSRLKECYGEEAEKILGANPTMMDLLAYVQCREAGLGSSKAFEVCRDTAGYAPKTQVEIENNVMSDADRQLLEHIAERMKIEKQK